MALINGNSTNNTLTGLDGEPNTLMGLDGNDSLVGAVLDDILDGGNGNDTLHGAEGWDILVGGSGNDYYIISDESGHSDYISNDDAGVDTVESRIPSYSLRFSPDSSDIRSDLENLILSKVSPLAIYGEGTDRANSLVGNNQGNTLVGLQGSDTIVGGSGNDLIYGAQETYMIGVLPTFLNLSGQITKNQYGEYDFLASLPDGSIILSSEYTNSMGVLEPILVKVLKSGLLDTTFGFNGVLTPSGVVSGLANPPDIDATNAGISMAGGKLLIENLVVDGVSDSYARLNSNGTPDTSFGSNGFFSPTSTSIKSDETLIASFGDGNVGFLVAKLDSTGKTIFQTFDKDGKTSVSTPPLDAQYDFSSLSTSPNVQFQGSKVVVFGHFPGLSTPVLVRLTATGSLDSTGTTSFGTNGILTLGADTLSVGYDFHVAEVVVRNDAIFVKDIISKVIPGAAAVLRFSADGKSPVALDFPPQEIISNVEVLTDGRIVTGVINGSTGLQFKIYNYNSTTKT